MNKRLICLVIAVIFIVTAFAIPATAAEDIHVFLNGEEIIFDVPPMIINDRTMVPMRAIFEAFALSTQVQIDWIDNKDQIAIDIEEIIWFNEHFEIPNTQIFDWNTKNPIVSTLFSPNYKWIAFQINSYAMFVAIEEDYDDVYYWIELDVPPQIVNDRTLVPLRAISEALDAEVEWHNDTRTVTITTTEASANDMETVDVRPTDDKPTLIMATNAAFPPFQFRSDFENAVDGVAGICVAIARIIANELGKELRVVDMSFSEIIPAVMAGQVDIGMAGMTITEARAQNVDFSIPYYTASQVIITHENSGIQSAADLVGTRVAVVLNYTGDFIASDMYDMNEIAGIVRVNSGIHTMLELMAGRADAVILDKTTATMFVEQNEGLIIVEDNEFFAGENYGIAVRQGNTELLNQINIILERLIAEGTIDIIVVNYSIFGGYGEF